MRKVQAVSRSALVRAVRNGVLLLLLPLLARSSIFAEPPALPGPKCDDNLKGTRILLVVLDAVRPDYLDLVPMPNLESIQQRGTSYEYAWVGQLINNTPTSHATINTGVFPRRHGVIGFEWADQYGRWQGKITLFGGVEKGRLSSLLIQSGVSTLADFVRKLYPCAHSAAVAGAKDIAAAAMGGRTAADWVVYAAPSEPSTAKGHPRYTNVHPGTVPGHEPPADILQDTALYAPGPLGAMALDK